MSVHKLLAALKKEAELQEKAIREEAEKRAGEILAAAGKRTAELQARIESMEKECQARREALCRTRKKMLQRKRATLAQDRIVSEIFSECAKRFREFMGTPAYADFLKREYERMREEWPEIEELRADPRSAAILEGAGAPGVIRDESLGEGFLAATEEGRVILRSLFRFRMEKAWKAQAPSFMARISKESGSS